MSVHDGPPAEPEPGGESMTVEVDGTSRQLPVEHDYTGDGDEQAPVEPGPDDQADGSSGPGGGSR